MEAKHSNSYTLPANGEWQTLLSDLEGISAYEISGYSQGKESHGKYSVIHAIALNSYNGKRGRIKYSTDFYGWRWWIRIRLRWLGTPNNYDLQIRTRSNYGDNGRIVVSVKNLLNNEFEIVH